MKRSYFSLFPSFVGGEVQYNLGLESWGSVYPLENLLTLLGAHFSIFCVSATVLCGGAVIGIINMPRLPSSSLICLLTPYQRAF